MKSTRSAIGFAALMAVAAMAGGGAVLAQQTPAPAPAAAMPPATGLGKGYLPMGPMADSTLLSPAPPAAGSVTQGRDDEASKAGLALSGTPRWTLATADADLFGPKITSAFSCAAGVEISAQTTPKLHALLRKTMVDLGMSTSAIKKTYQRGRPFMTNNQPTCTPSWEPMLRKDGSYPSGHSAIGWGWGLILAEVIPDRTAELVARGRAFGDSRRVCNAHWLSDIEEGRIVASATVARLNADPAFRADLDAAREELKQVKAPPTGCDAEAAALALVH